MISHHFLKKIITCSVMVFLFIPIINDCWELFPEQMPHGVPPASNYRAPRAETLLNRKWQGLIEARAKKESGLLTPFYKIATQIYYYLYQQISPFNDQSILLGNEKHIFQSAHLPEFNRKQIKPKVIFKRLKLLKVVQDYYRKNNKTLILLISPTMISLYPELVPQKFINPNRLTLADNYQTLIKYLDQLGIIYVDSFNYLKSIQPQYPFKFFAPTASHWNDVASCLTIIQINNVLKTNNLTALREIDCNNWSYAETPKNKDQDLLQLANLLYPNILYEQTPYVDISYLEPEPRSKPKVLLAGSSYFFAINDQLAEYQLTSESRHYFYFKQWRRGGEKKFYNVKPEQITLAHLLENDLTIVNVSTSDLKNVSNRFINFAVDLIRQERSAARKSNTRTIP